MRQSFEFAVSQREVGSNLQLAGQQAKALIQFQFGTSEWVNNENAAAFRLMPLPHYRMPAGISGLVWLSRE
jgi:hypothetical protein